MAESSLHPIEFLPELALGVLPTDEAEHVRAHLAVCDTCSAEYREMAEVAHLLPFASDEIRVSPAVRQGVMERIGREAPAPVPLKSRGPRLPIHWFPVPVAASIVLLVAAGVGWGFAASNWGGGGNPQANTERETALLTALINGSAQSSSARDGSVHVTFVHAPQANAGFISGSGFPALPKGKAYEAWFTKDGTHMEPATVFNSQSGTWIEAPGPIDQFVAMGFTVEDEAGAKSPTSQPFALIHFAHPSRQ